MAKKKITSIKKTPKQIYTLSISIEGTSPLVWRKIMVDGSFSLEALHSILQLVFGWQMSHLYEFEIGKSRYSTPDDESDTFPCNDVSDSIQDVVGTNRSFFYTYDFGDDWRHKITVENISPPRDLFQYPICVDGANACPPEDCGGIPGFAKIKEDLLDPENPEYAETLTWLGGYYNPLSFDPNRINRDFLANINWNMGPNDQGLYLPFQDV